MDRDARTRARLEQHWAASESGDIDTEHAIYAADAILDYPQSGERFRGRAKIQAQRGGHPADRALASFIVASAAFVAIFVALTLSAFHWAVAAPVAAAVVSGVVAAAIADGIAGLGNYAAIAGIVALFSLAVAAPTAVLARIRPPLVALAVLAFIVFGIPASGGPANLASFTPGFLRVLSPVLPLGIAASTIRNVVYFGGHATSTYIWTLAAWALAGVVGLILVMALRRSAPALTEPVTPLVPADIPLVPAEPVSARPGHAPVSGIPGPGPARSVTLVVGFDDSEPARRALIWGADLLRTRPGALHVIYADHVLIDSDLAGFMIIWLTRVNFYTFSGRLRCGLPGVARMLLGGFSPSTRTGLMYISRRSVMVSSPRTLKHMGTSSQSCPANSASQRSSSATWRLIVRQSLPIPMSSSLRSTPKARMLSLITYLWRS